MLVVKKIMRVPLFYKPKPTFGLDIGRSTIKMVQLSKFRSQIKVAGYGYARFEPNAIAGGQIVNPDIVVETIKKLLSQQAVGKLTAKRAVLSIPIAHSYTRIVKLPSMPQKDLAEAVKLEAEQYIPINSKDLYIEHTVLTSTAESMSVLVVAVPQTIVDSHVHICELLGLEISAIEPNMFANLRAVDFNCAKHLPKIVIDFGAHSSDLAIHDSAIRLTSTVGTGGEHITKAIADGLRVSMEEAHRIKIRYGIAKSRWQVQLASVLQPILSNFSTEVQKTMRYYHEHNRGKTNIAEIFMLGGGANMPGLADFLSHLTGVNVQICNPWQNLSIKPLQPPHPAETTIYATAVGLALKEFQDDN